MIKIAGTKKLRKKFLFKKQQQNIGNYRSSTWRKSNKIETGIYIKI